MTTSLSRATLETARAESDRMSDTEREHHAELMGIVGELGRLAGFERPTRAQEARAAELHNEFDRIADLYENARATRLHGEIRAGLASGQHQTEAGAFRGTTGPGGDPLIVRGGAPATGGDVRSAALRNIDRLSRQGLLRDGGAEAAAAVLERGTLEERDQAAEYMAVAGAEHYAGAVMAILRDPARGHMEFTAEQADAYRAARQWQARAMATDPMSAGGVLVPLMLDPAIVLQNGSGSGGPSALRAACRTVPIITNAYRAVGTEGVSAQWRAEMAEVTESGATLDEIVIPTHSQAVYTEASYELLMDAPDALTQLQAILADARINHEAVALADGTGVGQPLGLYRGAAAVPGSVSTLAGAALASADLRAVQGALPSRWQANARWFAPLDVFNQVDGFEDLAGGRMAEALANNGTILRRPVVEVPEFAGIAAGGADAVVYGDPAHYLIADRLGATFEVSQSSLLGPNRRPILARGILLHARVGAGLITPAAFRAVAVPA
jgi:HK97 family phage major capsid protein